MRRHAWAALCLLVCMGAGAAHAQVGHTPSIAMHGFMSQGFILTRGNNYLAEAKRGSVEFTEVGLNVTSQLTDELRLGVQLFSRRTGPTGGYTPNFDWFYLDYRFRDWLGVRAGRTKIPFGLYNEVNDIDMARVPVLLPQAVYGYEERDALLAQTGAELYGNIPLAAAGSLEYRLYGGTIFLGSPGGSGALTISDLSVPYLAGGRLMWSPPVEGLSLGGSAQFLQIDVDYQLDPALAAALVMAGMAPAGFTGQFGVELPLKLWVVSLEYVLGDLLLSVEYGRWTGDVKSSVPALLPDTHVVNERGYLMVSYRLARWFTPGGYYSAMYGNIHDRKGRDAYHHDLAGTLRFDINSYWLVKLEGHLVHGTLALESSLNGDRPLNQLTRTWGIFLLKTTAYF